MIPYASGFVLDRHFVVGYNLGNLGKPWLLKSRSEFNNGFLFYKLTLKKQVNEIKTTTKRRHSMMVSF